MCFIRENAPECSRRNIMETIEIFITKFQECETIAHLFFCLEARKRTKEKNLIFTASRNLGHFLANPKKLKFQNGCNNSESIAEICEKLNSTELFANNSKL